MTTALRHLSQQEQLNFLLGNRIPRRAATQFMGWYSHIESPWLTRLSVKLWQLFADDLRLHEATEKDFISLQECFTRRLVPGARPVDVRPDVVISPCDAIVGECGSIQGNTVFQAKGFPYEIGDLIPDSALQDTYRSGRYITLRLKSSMYHRFHAPVDCSVDEVRYISGDTWNVNPIALKRMKFHCLPETLSLKYRGPNRISCQSHYQKGDEMGYFQHGSTIIMFATSNYALADAVRPGETIRMGEALMIDTAASRPHSNSVDAALHDIP
jgi:phosphatidylserine decarboxylase